MSRPAGLPNKNKQALIALLQAKYPGYHPVMQLAAIANNDIECDVCGGEGMKLAFPGVEITNIREDARYTDEPCEHCVNGKSIITMDMKFNANREVAQYVTPKLKAVEHSGNIDSEQTHKHKVSFVSSK